MRKLSIILCILLVMLMANVTLATTYYQNDVTPPWGKIAIQGGTVSNNVTYVEDENVTVKIEANDNMCTKDEIKYYLSTSKITKTTVIPDDDWKSLADGDTAEVKLANTEGIQYIYAAFKDFNGNTSFVSENKNQILTYDVNGGTDAPKGVDTTRTYGEPFILTNQMPKKEGAYFIGWSTDPMATAPSFRYGDIIPADMVIAGDTLYAVYTTEVKNLPTVSEKLEISDKVNMPITYSNAEVNGNKSYFSGWKILSENADGSINLVSSGTPLTFYHGTDAENSIEALTTNFATTLFDSSGFESGDLKEIFNNEYIKKDANGNPMVRALTAEDILNVTEKNEIQLGSAMNLTEVSYGNIFDNDTDYWVATKNGSNLYTINSSGEVGLDSNKEYGVRVVITIKDKVRVADNDSLGVWEIAEQSIKIKYDSNGGTFEEGTINKVSYEETEGTITKISKTSNVSEDGLTADTSKGYGNNQEFTDVIQIPGAQELTVKITYQTESTIYDWIDIYDGNDTKIKSKLRRQNAK